MALETMDTALRDAALALDAMEGDAITRMTCADKLDGLRNAIAQRRARLASDIAALRDADTAGWLRRMAAGIQRD